ncbi:MAG: ribbon-helix-helix domain-containing protein [Methanobrevibacter sp.]|nr:ribbon-helix-helix domain-containing protein [Methanobrevibacter sp.]
MAKDTLKNRVRISSTLTHETDKKLKDFSKKTQIPISKIIEASVLQYIEKWGE